MNRIAKPPRDNIVNISFLIESWEQMVRRQDQRTWRHASSDDTKRASMTDIFRAALEKHLILNSDRFDSYPKLKAAIREYVEQMRHTSDSMDLHEVAGSVDEECGGGWEEVHTAGRAEAKGKAKGKGKSKTPATGHGKSLGSQGGKGPQTGTRGEVDRAYLQYNCTKAKGKGREKKGVYVRSAR